jgi:hypothetical protein
MDEGMVKILVKWTEFYGQRYDQESFMSFMEKGLDKIVVDRVSWSKSMERVS